MRIFGRINQFASLMVFPGIVLLSSLRPLSYTLRGGSQMFDVIFFSAVVNELQEILAGEIVRKIHQPSPHTK